jgi:mRNA-degrading endonuclease HigB of HigAB toxin-antitoxin module
LIVGFSKPEIVNGIFNSFQNKQQYKDKNTVCAITGQKAKYFDPLTGQYYCNKEAFKAIREKYFQKEEDNLLFRIQTLSDLASQKKEKLKKMLLNPSVMSQKKSMLDIVSKIGIMKSDPIELEKKHISSKLRK